MVKILIVMALLSIVVLSGCIVEPKYYYVGRITNIEGGSSRSLIILTLDNGQKMPYTTQQKCSNKIRLGQEVYSSSKDNYLWIEYDVGKFC